VLKSSSLVETCMDISTVALLKPLKLCLIYRVAEGLLASEEGLYCMDLSVFRFNLCKGDVSFCDCTKVTEGSSGGLIGHTR
jgi:hypothetical protein